MLTLLTRRSASAQKPQNSTRRNTAIVLLIACLAVVVTVVFATGLLREDVQKNASATCHALWDRTGMEVEWIPQGGYDGTCMLKTPTGWVVKR
jgi:hypothetical protein